MDSLTQASNGFGGSRRRRANGFGAVRSGNVILSMLRTCEQLYTTLTDGLRSSPFHNVNTNMQ